MWAHSPEVHSYNFRYKPTTWKETYRCSPWVQLKVKMAETDVQNEPQQTDLYWQDSQSPFSWATFPNSPAQKALDFPQRFSVTSSDRESTKSRVLSASGNICLSKASTHKNHTSPLRPGISTSFPFRCRPSEVIWTKQRCGQIGQDQGLSWGKEKCIVFLFFFFG